jgi:hypothetical protein
MSPGGAELLTADPAVGGAGDEDEGVGGLKCTDDDELTGRILSLPNIMCRAANGDIFVVGLG